jgi:hypothetical protein
MLSTRRTEWLMAAIAVVLLGAPVVRAIDCDDSDPCTINDACGVDGMCQGTFQVGAKCDDFDGCTKNDTCTVDPVRGNICEGEPGSVGDPCGGGCGTCQQLIPVPGAPLQCSGNTADNGKSCDPSSIANLGPCFVGACNITGAGGINFAFCFPAVKVCPDTDGDPCTDNCNFNTGKCEKNAQMCDEVCNTCNHTTGMCQTKAVGIACEDFNPCSAQSSCQTISQVPFAFCMAGAATVNSPTPTVTPMGATPTVVATSTATVGQPTSTATSGPSPTPMGCVGDCDANKIVVVNEVVKGVAMAQGNLPLSSCPVFDTNGNHMVDINELIGAVASLLNGCV